MIANNADEERALILLSSELAAQFDAVLQAEPPTITRISAAFGAIAGVAASIISMLPREAQAQALSGMTKAIRERLKEYAAEDRSKAH